jgi:hypothetical protein
MPTLSNETLCLSLVQVQSYFNSDVSLRSPGYVLSESWTGITYSGIDLHKLAGDDYYEFLPTSAVEISEKETADCLIPVVSDPLLSAVE